MSTILMTVPDGGGTVPPDLSVALALRRRGHQVRVLSDPVLRPEVEAAGAEHVPWTRAPHRLDRSLESEIIRDWEARTPMGGFAQMRDRIACGPAADYAGDVVAELARVPADAVVTDFVLPGAMIAAEAAGLPLVILGTTIYPFPVPDVPPMGPGFMPAHGDLGPRSGWSPGCAHPEDVGPWIAGDQRCPRRRRTGAGHGRHRCL